MFDIDENIRLNQNLVNRVDEIGKTIKIDDLTDRLKELEKKTEDNNFWNNADESSIVLAEISNLKSRITKYNDVKDSIFNDSEILEMLKIESDEELEKEIVKSISENVEKLENLEIQILFSDKYDNSNAIVTIHPGAGGTEAMDWADMLYRMYSRWADKHGFKIEELDYLAGEEAGIKSVTFLVSGEYAYGYLKSEHGVHRLVRISPFDAGGRRHTSFASVEVLPEIKSISDVEIKPDDIKMDVYRASGAGGQHVNKTSSAVRLTHIPTGIVVACQTQRSQFQNKDYAMKMLISKLIHLKEQEHRDTINDLKGVNGGRLSYDFYVNHSGVEYLIECQGGQHYRPIDLWGGEKAFNLQIEHDKLKSKYADDNGYKLLIVGEFLINYDDIKKFLDEYLV